MNTQIPGLDELVQVFKQASHGPFNVQAGTVLDAKHEIVAEFATRDDAAAIGAFFSIKEEFIELLLALPPMFAPARQELTEEEKQKLSDALIRFKERILTFAKSEE